MDISPGRIGVQVVAGGVIGGGLVSVNGVQPKVLTYGAGVGAVSAATQTFVHRATGDGFLSLMAGTGSGAVTGAAMFRLFSESGRAGRALAVGAGLGAALGFVSSFGGFIAGNVAFPPKQAA